MRNKTDDERRDSLLHFDPKETKKSIARSKKTRSSADINATLLVLSGNTPGRNERYTDRPHHHNICKLCDLNIIDDGHHALVCPFNNPLWLKTTLDTADILAEAKTVRIQKAADKKQQDKNNDPEEGQNDQGNKSTAIGTLPRHTIRDDIQTQITKEDWKGNLSLIHI